MSSEPDELRARLAEVERQRDSAFARIAELVGDLETHRDFWKRGQVETEDAKLLASQAHNRAQRLQGRVREMTSRRARDRENEALRAIIVRRIACDFEGVLTATLMQIITDASHQVLGISAASMLADIHKAVRDARGG